MIECSGCGEPKSDADFYWRNGKRNGRRCKDCRRKASLTNYRKDPKAKIERQRGGALMKKYGLTVEQYNALLEHQDGRCYICEKKPQPTRRLAVDHDHRTGLVRGLLCSEDNYMLGWMHDNARRLARSAGYIDHPPATLVLGFHRVPGAPPVRQNDRPEKGTD